MPSYRRVGSVPRKRHTQFRRPDGDLYAEELLGVEGFSGEFALLYHAQIPTAIVAAEAVAKAAPLDQANHPLMPRHFKTSGIKTGGNLVEDRHLLLGNDDVRLSFAAPSETSPLYRDAAGDELVFIQSGQLALESAFGRLDAAAGDYVVIPTSVTHRWVIREQPVRALIVEASGHIGPPKRYLSTRGQFLEHSPFCERDLRAPDELLAGPSGEAEVLVRHKSGWTRLTYAFHPFDVVGWDGCLYPYALNIADFEPITGRIHQPPPVHQTFEGPNFVVCSFVPRKFDYHPLAIPAPYNHANVDSDEVLFYVEGEFMSRAGAGIEAGSISVHPSGFTHGPQPGSVEASIGATETHELAVMVDTFRPLRIAAAALAVEDVNYPWTWARAASNYPQRGSDATA